MRIKIGNQVEVWIQETGSPVGAWRGGVVTWGNGHSYTLRWDGGDGDGEVSGRISRKSVRPRPPPAPVPRDLDAGDMIEVFDDDDCLWKCAEVQGAAAADGRHFDVKIVGASKFLTVPPQRLRMRQLLRGDDVWVAIHKDNHQTPVPSGTRPRANGGSAGMGIGRGKGGHRPMPIPPGSTPLLQKRSFGMMPYSTSTPRFPKRHKEDNKCGAQQGLVVSKVCLNKQDEMSDSSDSDSSSSSDDSSSSNSSTSSSSSSSNSSSRTRSMEANENWAAAPTTRPPCNDQMIDHLQPSKKEHYPNDDQKADHQPQPSMKEQYCNDQRADHQLQPSKKEHCEIKCETLEDQMGAVREHDHRLGLEAYASVLKVFHARGDGLSWEKEGLLSDLRVELHVSNEEHLQVLNAILKRKGRTAGARLPTFE